MPFQGLHASALFSGRPQVVAHHPPLPGPHQKAAVDVRQLRILFVFPLDYPKCEVTGTFESSET